MTYYGLSYIYIYIIYGTWYTCNDPHVDVNLNIKKNNFILIYIYIYIHLHVPIL